MSRGQNVALFVAGAACTFASQVKLPALVPWSEALAGLGFMLAGLADKAALLPRRHPPDGEARA